MSGDGAGGDDIGYADAVEELEAILDELEGDQLDVDVLAERVRRASELIKVCRVRIGRAQTDVDRIVTDLETFESELDGAAPPASEGESGAELF
jgi:exodeoxyribonuclease VII small subunit